MKKNYTHITMVVDRSGSMGSIRSDAQGGVNAFIAANKAVDSQCTISLYEFDTFFDKVYSGDIQEAPEYKLEPRGGTALLDAQMRAINETGKMLKDMPESERPDKVIFLTVTDGEENSSTELRGTSGAATLKKKVEEQTNKYNWEFAYIGANQDAFEVGSSMGYTSTISYASTGASTKGVYANMTDSVIATRTTGSTLSSNLASSVDEHGNITKKDANT